jgi:hypothetical protein
MHGRTRTEPNATREWARTLAVVFTRRAWDLIERPQRTAAETTEMLDSAQAARALWRLATGSPANLEALRAHHAVACACYRAEDARGTRAAANLAGSCAWVDGRDATTFDHAMTMTANYLARVLQNGFTDPEPLMEVIAALSPEERAVFSRILPWPKERFGPGPKERFEPGPKERFEPGPNARPDSGRFGRMDAAPKERFGAGPRARVEPPPSPRRVPESTTSPAAPHVPIAQGAD